MCTHNDTTQHNTHMARKQTSDKPSSKAPAKMENKHRSNTKNAGTVNEDEEIEVVSASSQSSDSTPAVEEGDADEEVCHNADNDEEELIVEDTDDDEVEEDEVAVAAEVKNKKTDGSNQKKKKKNSKDNCNGTGAGAGAVDEPSSLYRFPMQRVSRIIKSEDPGVRITQEAVFAINKASEMFLQLFSMEAYACAFLDRKKFVAYKHLSSVVTKRKRFDFLSDFVPEKLKAEDALKEIPSMDTS